MKSRLALTLALACLPLVTPPNSTAADWSPEQIEFFEAKIRPVLANRCYECHSATKGDPDAGLRLDTAPAVLRGGDSGPVLVPGKPDESLLIEALRYESYEMPPDGKLDEATVTDFVHWIEMGAPDPREAISEEMADKADGDAQSAMKHWAFQPPVRAELPEVEDPSWPQSEIDRFVLSRLETKGLTPSPRADERTLLRRLSYDLIGLPPTMAEVEEYENDQSAEATERQVDRLLASPHFGERWGRHWLDVARYADTKGYVFQESREYAKAYTYRDWIVRAFNDDMPYRLFVLSQIAGDQIGGNEEEKALEAMGFLTLGRRFLNRQHDIIDDRIDVVTRGLMGLTVACARCHDHKYDPIPTADYYSLYGVFASCDEPRDEANPLGLVDKPKPVEPHIFLRGNPASRGDRVPRQFLQALSGEDRQPFENGSGRLELAEAIADEANPLTARVWANRVWGHLLGQGLVDTPSDFGVRSDPPSHPELLDWLALQLIEDGWSTKKLIRRIVLSNVYQQTSDRRDEAYAVDPENRLFWKTNRRRLDLESLRDSVLAVAGRLDETVGGPPVQLGQSPFPTRRTLYGKVARQNLPGMFRTFDFANPDAHVPKRYLTVVPQQALFMMNSPFMMEQAEHLTSLPHVAGQPDTEKRIRSLYQTALAREPDPDELVLGVRFMDGASKATADSAPVPDWQYGYGHFDENAKRLVNFTPLPHFTGSSWQGGPQTPDPKLGWVILSAEGGHPGNDHDHAVVRRWIAPAAGTLKIGGNLQHDSDQGDGVRAIVVSGRDGVSGDWIAHNQKASTKVDRASVEAGDTIDFVIDCRTNPGWDGFKWTVTLALDPRPENGSARWDSRTGFRGPPPSPLDPWSRYAQTLLMTNEFAYID
jgi:uncharacterized protein DUF1553/uncharacterized protein DUF1549/cytochrome c